MSATAEAAAHGHLAPLSATQSEKLRIMIPNIEYAICAIKVRIQYQLSIW
jgi:hypothetical protein